MDSDTEPQNQIVTFDWHAHAVAFTGEAYVNLTHLCAAFDEKPVHFLRLEATQRFIAALAADTGLPPESEVRNPHFTRGLVHAVRGNFADAREQGTWAHPDLALECARWLSPEFAIWTNRVIRRVLSGQVAEFQSAAMLRASAKAKAEDAAYARERFMAECDVPGNVSVYAYSVAARLPVKPVLCRQVGNFCRIRCQAGGKRIGLVRQATKHRSKRSLVSTYPPDVVREGWLHFGYEHAQPLLEAIEAKWRPLLSMFHRLNAAPPALVG
jgi:hypothetical protein